MTFRLPRPNLPPLPTLALSLLPALLLQAVRLASGAAFSWSGLGLLWAFCLLVLALAWAMICPPRLSADQAAAGLLLAGLAGGLLYLLTGSGLAAGGLLAVFYSLLLYLDLRLAPGPLLYRWAVHGFLAAAAGLAPVILAEVEARFSEEEFFVALQALALALSWLLLRAVYVLWRRTGGLPPAKPLNRRGRLTWAGLLLVAALGGLFVTVRSYQSSFYPPQAPAYPGIDEQTPILCGPASAPPTAYHSRELFQRILDRVAANPYIDTPEYGMLALGGSDSTQAQIFHDRLLEEAHAGRFAGPAHSVKYIQYEAALRAYYYPRIRLAFPGLFSDAEDQALREWFAAINRRTLTVEWVDWMYGLAFSMWPEGPYENQENGAGLLAVLESEGLADPALSVQNRDYLARNPRGWQPRFRVTDDAVIYQPEWITNAYFQWQYTGLFPAEHARQSFDWLLLQALPDGSLLRYNHPGAISLADSAYQAAQLFSDGRYLWLAGRMLDYLDTTDGFLFARPGIETPFDLAAEPPEAGSCLLYGDSGLPNQDGPLAPDKVVLRGGWRADDPVLLLNLRFTGWHRYKATNTVTLLHQAGPLLNEQIEGESFAWLPAGRALFRDKRIPRENLNGLVVRRDGLSAVLYALTGAGGPWAQDPPFYAEVERFSLDQDPASSVTWLRGWHGWEHRRSAYLFADGPIVVADVANGPAGSAAALVWHTPAGGPLPDPGTGEVRLLLRAGEPGAAGQPAGQQPAELVLLPLQPGQVRFQPETLSGQAGAQVTYEARGSLSLVSIFLTGRLVGAQVTLEEQAGSRVLRITQGPEQFKIILQ